MASSDIYRWEASGSFVQSVELTLTGFGVENAISIEVRTDATWMFDTVGEPSVTVLKLLSREFISEAEPVSMPTPLDLPHGVQITNQEAFCEQAIDQISFTPSTWDATYGLEKEGIVGSLIDTRP